MSKKRKNICLYQDVSIGTNLKKLRIRTGLSQEEVSLKLQLRDIQITREVISQIENSNHGIKVSVLLALKDLYMASFDEIFKPQDPTQE